MSQFLMLSVYYTVCDHQYESEMGKLERLEKILKLIKGHSKFACLMQVLDQTEVKKLRQKMHLERLRKIKNLSEEERISELKLVI